MVASARPGAGAMRLPSRGDAELNYWHTCSDGEKPQKSQRGFGGDQCREGERRGFVHGALYTSEPSGPTQTPISAVTVVSLIWSERSDWKSGKLFKTPPKMPFIETLKYLIDAITQWFLLSRIFSNFQPQKFKKGVFLHKFHVFSEFFGQNFEENLPAFQVGFLDLVRFRSRL